MSRDGDCALSGACDFDFGFGGAGLAGVVEYMRAHWPSKVKPEWQVGLEEYPAIAERVTREWAAGASTGREMVRIAGLSGSGKTTQLLPAVESYFEARGARPVLVAARKFVEYHPFYQEILTEYGESKLRAMTDEFSTIMMFLVLAGLIKIGCDIILDVTLLDPKIEGILLAMLAGGKYEFWMSMVAVAPEVTEKFLGKRAWRHTRETELEFMRATRGALGFYAEKVPEMRIVLWNVWEEEPVYDGEVRGCLGKYDECVKVVDVPEHSEEILRNAKIRFLLDGLGNL